MANRNNDRRGLESSILNKDILMDIDNADQEQELQVLKVAKVRARSVFAKHKFKLLYILGEDLPSRRQVKDEIECLIGAHE